MTRISAAAVESEVKHGTPHSTAARRIDSPSRRARLLREGVLTTK
jgi:hypothetical protein